MQSLTLEQLEEKWKERDQRRAQLKEAMEGVKETLLDEPVIEKVPISVKDKKTLSLTVNIDVPHKLPPFSAADFESICSIAREALSNAMRHAHATEVGIRAWQDSHIFQMMIWDNGEGFNPEDIPEDAGLGLRNIRERVRLHQGALSIDSAPDQGTTLKVAIPIADGNQPDSTR